MPTTSLILIECTNLIRTNVNNHNSVVYVDMMEDMRQLNNGVFQCSLRVNDGFITDYTLMRLNAYTGPTSIYPKAQ